MLPSTEQCGAAVAATMVVAAMAAVAATTVAAVDDLTHTIARWRGRGNIAPPHIAQKKKNNACIFHFDVLE